MVVATERRSREEGEACVACGTAPFGRFSVDEVKDDFVECSFLGARELGGSDDLFPALVGGAEVRLRLEGRVLVAIASLGLGSLAGSGAVFFGDIDTGLVTSALF